MSEELLETSYSPATLQKQYCLDKAEARRLLTSFGSCQLEMDRLLAARGRTRLHRKREIHTPISSAPFGIG